MKQFKSLNAFINYCNEINSSEEEDNLEFLLISALAASSTREELLDDAKDALTEYYKWLAVAIEYELFESAGAIQNALQSESDHYIQLGKAVLKKNLKKDITELNTRIKLKTLGY